MSIQIQVRDRHGNPIGNTNVRIQFRDGFANVYTDASGNAELRTGGYIVSTKVHGTERQHNIHTRDVERTSGAISHKMP